MPRGNKVTTSFRKAARTPSARAKLTPKESPLRTPKGLSPLSQYIEDNKESGLSVRELVEQFQEYDCEHPEKEQRAVAEGSTYWFFRCEICQRIEKKMKPGAK